MRTGKPICLHLGRHRAADRGARGSFRARAALRVCAGSRARSATDTGSAASSRAPSSAPPQAGFTRTGNRKDFATPPPDETILDILVDGRPRRRHRSARSATSSPIAAPARRSSRTATMPASTAALSAMRTLPDGGFVFANLVDFDTEFGHRRDVAGLCRRARGFRRAGSPKLPASCAQATSPSSPPTTATIPTWRGTDHTREHVADPRLRRRHRAGLARPARHLRRYRRDGREAS